MNWKRFVETHLSNGLEQSRIQSECVETLAQVRQTFGVRQSVDAFQGFKGDALTGYPTITFTAHFERYGPARPTQSSIVFG